MADGDNGDAGGKLAERVTKAAWIKFCHGARLNAICAGFAIARIGIFHMRPAYKAASQQIRFRACAAQYFSRAGPAIYESPGAYFRLEPSSAQNSLVPGLLQGLISDARCVYVLT